MLDKKELKEEELEKVSGGKMICLNGNLDKYSDYTNFVGKYDGCPCLKYLFKKNDTQWLFGTYLNSYQGKDNKRIHVVNVDDGQGNYTAGYIKFLENKIDVDASGNYELDGDEYNMYINR